MSGNGFEYESEPKETVKSCNNCGWERFEPFAERDRYGLPVKTVRCTGCALVFINPRMVDDGYRRFYADGHYRTLLTKFYGKPILPSTMKHSQELYAEALAAYLEPWLTKRTATSVLDVGGSTGIVAGTMARRFGLAGTVLDPAESELALASKAGLATILGTAEGFEPDGQRWGLVLLCQVVDHLLDIRGTLAKLRNAVAPRGLFYMDIACFDELDVKQRLPDQKLKAKHQFSVGKLPEKLVKVDHPYCLGRAHAKSYLDRAGFEVVSQSKGPLTYQVGYLCRRREGRGANGTDGPG